MGLFPVRCKVLNPATSKATTVRRLMVGTGAESTWIDAAVLEGIGIERRKKDLQFQLANGQIVTRSAGYAVLKVDRAETADEVVSAEKGDLQLLGARALEGLNLQVDSRRKRLVAAGPIISAAAVPPRFGHLVQVPLEAMTLKRGYCPGTRESIGSRYEPLGQEPMMQPDPRIRFPPRSRVRSEEGSHPV